MQSYVYPVNNVAQEASTKELYKDYVSKNSDIPDYSRLKTYGGQEGNKYIICLMIANQIALA